MTARTEEIIKNTGIPYSRDVDIKGYSTLGLSAIAAIVAMPLTVDEAVALARTLYVNNILHRFVGGMSNTMPSSNYYDGVVVNLRKISRKTVAENYVTAECGTRLSSMVRALYRNSLGGMEQLFHIPGTLGGAVCGNAGAHGLEISDVFIRGDFYSPERDAVLTFTRDEMNFSYRYSRLKEESMILLNATLAAVPTVVDEIDRRIEHFRKLRQNQPMGEKTLGSTFKRVSGVSAGYYIDRAGLKGLSVGGASVSKVHAGFIVNRGDATVFDVLRLIEIIKTRVLSKFGITLEEEIVFL